jgi:hypothetical protein
MRLESNQLSKPFQAEYEGSIPFTRSIPTTKISLTIQYVASGADCVKSPQKLCALLSRAQIGRTDFPKLLKFR